MSSSPGCNGSCETGSMGTATNESARVAMITGAARGLGAAAARELSARGWEVALVDVAADIPGVRYAMGTVAEMEQVAVECGRAATYVADVRDQASLDAVVADLSDRHGGIDAVVAAAGVICGGAALAGAAQGKEAQRPTHGGCTRC